MVKKQRVLPHGVKFLIGIDEVGRGPLAGPVAVGAFLTPIDFDFSYFEGVRDSKKLPPHKREHFLNLAIEKSCQGEIAFAVSFVSHLQIDRKGITFAINRAMRNALKRLNVDEDECLVLLDGGLKAPLPFSNQETIIKGDDKEKIISLASVVAKVIRDKKLIRLSKKYPGYDFHINKGYGTSQHKRQLELLGPSPIHRISFLGNYFASI